MSQKKVQSKKQQISSLNCFEKCIIKEIEEKQTKKKSTNAKVLIKGSAASAICSVVANHQFI